MALLYNKSIFALYSQPEGSSVTGQKNTYRTGNDIVKTIDEGLIETKKDLINDLDNRSIVQLSPMKIPLVSKWHDEEYVILDAYFTKFIYNKKYESDIHDAYCRFVERVFKDSKKKIDQNLITSTNKPVKSNAIYKDYNK